MFTVLDSTATIILDINAILKSNKKSKREKAQKLREKELGNRNEEKHQLEMKIFKLR